MICPLASSCLGVRFLILLASNTVPFVQHLAGEQVPVTQTGRDPELGIRKPDSMCCHFFDFLSFGFQRFETETVDKVKPKLQVHEAQKHQQNTKQSSP